MILLTFLYTGSDSLMLCEYSSGTSKNMQTKICKQKLLPPQNISECLNPPPSQSHLVMYNFQYECPIKHLQSESKGIFLASIYKSSDSVILWERDSNVTSKKMQTTAPHKRNIEKVMCLHDFLSIHMPLWKESKC